MRSRYILPKSTPRFEFFDHTAEVGLLAYGSDLKEAFANAAYGLISFLTDPETVRAEVARDIEVTAQDQAALVVAWLNELLFLLGVENLLFRKFEVTELDETRLRARAYGEVVDPARHRIKTEVKSATYHLLSVEKNERWRIRVILDV